MRDLDHGVFFATYLRGEPGYAAALLAEVVKDADPGELDVLLRHLSEAFGGPVAEGPSSEPSHGEYR